MQGQAMKPRYIQETYAEAVVRVPELRVLEHDLVSASISNALNLVDCMDGYDLFQAVTAPMEACIFIYKAKPTTPPTD